MMTSLDLWCSVHWNWSRNTTTLGNVAIHRHRRVRAEGMSDALCGVVAIARSMW